MLIKKINYFESDLFSPVSYGGGGGGGGGNVNEVYVPGTSNNKSNMGNVGSLANAEGRNSTKITNPNTRVDDTVQHVVVQGASGGVSGCIGCHVPDPYTN